MRLLLAVILTLLAGFLLGLLVGKEVPRRDGISHPIAYQLVEVVPVMQFATHCGVQPPFRFDLHLRAASVEFGVDPRILATTVYRESRCDSKALGSSGEIGLGQVLPRVWTRTLRARGILRSATDLWEPKTNLRAAAFILSTLDGKGLHDLFRRYNGSGPAAERYAREQVRTHTTLWGG